MIVFESLSSVIWDCLYQETLLLLYFIIRWNNSRRKGRVNALSFLYVKITKIMNFFKDFI